MNWRFDNKFFTSLNRIIDMFLLTLLWFLFSLPIFTIGASSTAMYYTVNKVLKREIGYLWKEYWGAFKRNFKQATLAWLIVLGLLIFLLADFYLLSIVEVPAGFIIMVALCIAAFLLMGTTLYLFPLIGHFDNTLKNMLKNSLILSVSMFPKTLLMVLIWFFPLIVFIFSMELFLRSLLPWMLVGFALTARLNSIILRKIFMKLAPEEESKNTDEIPKEEY